MKLQRNHINRKMLETGVVVILIALLEYVFFEKVLFSDALIGDINDARLNNLLVEHWYNAFCGKESFSAVNIFYPMPGTVAFTDMLLGFAVPYSILRACGVDMYLANKIVLIAFHVIGSYAMFYLLRKKFKISNLWSFVGVLIFSYSSAYYIRIAHTQLIAITLIPIFAIFLYSFFEYFSYARKRIVYGFLTITSYVLIMYTSWYTAFFTALFMLTLGIVYLCVAYSCKNRVIKNVLDYVKKSYKEIMAYIVYAICIVIPFFMLYIPVSQRFGSRSYGEITKQLPELIDFFNVSTGNRMLGWLFEKLNVNGRDLFVWELHVGFSIVVLALLVIVYLRTKKHYQREKYGELTAGRTYRNTDVMLRMAMTYAVFVSFLLIVQSNGASLWFFVYKFVPGASAIRAVVRYNFFLTIPIAIIISVGGYRLFDKLELKRPFKLGIPLVLAALIWYSNSNIYGIQSDWRSSEEERQVNEVAAPPEDCEAMYIVDTNPSVHTYNGEAYSWVSYQHLAWEICEKYEIKNLNGYSGQFPVGWVLNNADGSDIHKYATDWIEGTGISSKVYYYDMGTNTWNEYVPVEW